MFLQRVPALANFIALVIPLYASHALHHFAIICYLARFLDDSYTL